MKPEKNNIPDISLFRHRADVQLRFNDVDVLGHVNNTVYYSFYDTGKALYFSEVRGLEMNWKNVDRIIANNNCAYLAPIFFGEKIEVLTRCIHLGLKSFTLQQMLRERETGEVKSVCESVMVCYDPQKHTSQEMSPELRRAFEEYDGKSLANT